MKKKRASYIPKERPPESNPIIPMWKLIQFIGQRCSCVFADGSRIRGPLNEIQVEEEMIRLGDEWIDFRTVDEFYRRTRDGNPMYRPRKKS